MKMLVCETKYIMLKRNPPVLGGRFYFPKMSFQSVRWAFRLRPLLVVGIPVALANLRFADVMPRARFQLNPKAILYPSPSYLVYALLAGGQAHADGSGVRGLPIGAAVTIAVVVILAAGAGDVDGLGRLGSGEHRCGGGAVPIHVQAQGIGDGAKRQINRAVNGEWLHGLTVGIDETYVLAIKCDAHVVIVYFFCDLAHGGGGGAMGLSSGHSAGRRRFTIAHELGHLLLNHKGDLINREPSPGDNPVEREANIFAARLLRRIASCGVWIPATQGSISELCNISYQAAEFRAKRISLLMGDCQSMQERGRPYFLQSPVEEKLYMQVLPYIKTHKAPLFGESFDD